MNLNVYKIDHSLKSNFLDKVYGYVDGDPSTMEQLIESYILGLEENDSQCWERFTDLKSVVEDFKRFAEYEQEEDYYSRDIVQNKYRYC
jgi:hypothetical protein